MVDGRRAVALALLAVGLGGCAGLPLTGRSRTPAPALNANVPTANQLAAPYRAQANQLERSGRQRQAVEAWTTALALAPDHEPSRQALRRLRQQIDRDIAEQVRLGWHALARDAVGEARRHFLAALALDPDSRAARDGLLVTAPAPAPEPDVKPALPAPPAPRPATLITIDPPFNDPPKPRLNSSGPPETPPAPEVRPGNGSDTDKPDALYATATAHLAARRDEEAYLALTRLSRVSPGYRDSLTLLGEVRLRLVRQRYQEGLRLFREEMIEKAIEQWRAVLDLDPLHADAHRNIEQAEKMLRTLAAQPKR